MSSKLRSQSGETLAETMAAMLVAFLAMLMLAGAVVSAALVNSRVKNTDLSFSQAEGSGTKFYVTVKTDGYVEPPIEAVLYKTENGYYYYDVKTSP